MSTDINVQDIERLRYITMSSFETIYTHVNRISNYQKLLAEMNHQIQTSSQILNTFFIEQHNRLTQSPIFQLHQSTPNDSMNLQTIKAQAVTNLIRKGDPQVHNNIPLTLILEQFDSLSTQVLFSVDSLTKLIMSQQYVAIAQKHEHQQEIQPQNIKREAAIDEEILVQPEQTQTQTNVQNMMVLHQTSDINDHNLRSNDQPPQYRNQYKTPQTRLSVPRGPYKKNRQSSRKKVELEICLSYGKLINFGFDQLSYELASKEIPCSLCHRVDPSLEPIYVVPMNLNRSIFHQIHLPCLLYNNFIYPNKSLKVRKNDLKYLNAFMKQTCRLCNKFGASMKCFSKGCEKYYHFPCFMLDDSSGGIPQKYNVICPKHLSSSRKPACLLISKRYKEKQNLKRMTKIEFRQEEQDAFNHKHQNHHKLQLEFKQTSQKVIKFNSNQIQLQGSQNSTKFKLQLQQ